jgi:hypothetical protein
VKSALYTGDMQAALSINLTMPLTVALSAPRYGERFKK